MADTESKSKRCDTQRVVHPSKYEQNSKSVQEWWMKLFSQLEINSSIPPFLRKEVVQQVLPDHLFERVEKIVDLLPMQKTDSLKREHHVKSDLSASTIGSEDLSKREPSPVEKKEKPKQQIALDIETISPEIKTPSKFKNIKGNPYLKFLKKDAEEAQIWRTKIIDKFDEKSLEERAAIITGGIIDEFCGWLKKLGNDESSLDEEALQFLFKIGFEMDAATAIRVNMKEMSSVTQPVADANKVPKMATRAALRSWVLKDIKAERRPSRKVAFSTTLPKHMRYVPPDNQTYNRWIKCRIPQDLATMSYVWDGITHLRSTKRYCEYLLDHPDIPKPKFLVKEGMLDPTRRANLRSPSMEAKISVKMPSDVSIEEQY